MPARPCLTCGALTRTGSHCPAHEPQPWTRRSPSSRATARPGWNRIRALALTRDGHCCIHCGTLDDLAVHHVLPVADGGRNVLTNLATLCSNCHRTAHHAAA